MATLQCMKCGFTFVPTTVMEPCERCLRREAERRYGNLQAALRRLSSPSWCPQVAEAVRMNDESEDAEEAAVGVVSEMTQIAREALKERE